MFEVLAASWILDPGPDGARTQPLGYGRSVGGGIPFDGTPNYPPMNDYYAKINGRRITLNCIRNGKPHYIGLPAVIVSHG